MQDLWSTLESYTRCWHDLDRQAVADAVWADYVSVRFARTGDTRALQFLYPYLNRAEKSQRLQAIEVAGRVFEGRGAGGVEDLTYFTRNTDPFLRDRSVWPVAAAMVGAEPEQILEVLRPYLNHRNRFVRRQAAEALGRAAGGSGSEVILGELDRVAAESKLDEHAVRWTLARICQGTPNERVYGRIVDASAPHYWHGPDDIVGTLLLHAPEPWYLRGCDEFFRPRLAKEEGPFPHFLHGFAIDGLCMAGTGRGMHPLRVMLTRAGRHCSAYTMYTAARCFAGAPVQGNREELLAMLQTADVPVTRIIAVCLGRLLRGSEDAQTIERLLSLAGSVNGGVRAAALAGLGLVAKGSCNEQLHRLCLEQAKNEEAATEAVKAIGRIFAGSGRPDVLEEIRQLAEYYRSLHPGARHHSRPALACYAAVGDLYAGTGSSEPLDFLLKVLKPSPVAWCPFRWVAGGALVRIEFSQRAVARVLGDEP